MPLLPVVRLERRHASDSLEVFQGRDDGRPSVVFVRIGVWTANLDTGGTYYPSPEEMTRRLRIILALCPEPPPRRMEEWSTRERRRVRSDLEAAQAQVWAASGLPIPDGHHPFMPAFATAAPVGGIPSMSSILVTCRDGSRYGWRANLMTALDLDEVEALYAIGRVMGA